MKTVDVNIKMQFCQMDELSESDRRLVELAIKATDNSYAPYSRFRVGAGIRLENGMEIMGANQEKHIETLAIAARNIDGLTSKPVSPCGACRQVMLEIEDRYKKPMRVLLYGTDGVYVIQTVKDLMPLCFVDADMH